MMKYLKFTLDHMNDKFRTIVVIMLELLLVMFTFSYFLEGILTYKDKLTLYRNINASNIIQIDGSMECQDAIEEVVEANEGMVALGEAKNVIYTKGSKDTEVVGLQPVSEAFVKHVSYPLQTGNFTIDEINSDENIVFIPPNMKNKYKQGEYYTFTVSIEDETGTERDHLIRAYVGGVLKDDYIYYPKGGLELIKESENIMLVYLGKNKEIMKEGPKEREFWDRAGRSFMVYVENQKNIMNAMSQFKDIDGIENIYTADSVKETYEESQRSMLGIPFIVSIIIVFMSIASFSSYSMISILSKQKRFGIYYICGASRRQCMLIQMAEDMLLILIPAVIAMICIPYFCVYMKGTVISYKSQLLAIMLCVLIIMCSSLRNILKIKKEQPVDIIRRCI